MENTSSYDFINTNKFLGLSEEDKERANAVLLMLQNGETKLNLKDIKLAKLLVNHLELHNENNNENINSTVEDESPASKPLNPLDSNSTLMNFLNHNMNEKPVETLIPIYKATRDGDNNFHDFCDNVGPTLVLITANGHTFGGYTSINWDKSGAFRTDPNAFLFSLTNFKKYPINQSTNYWAIYCVSAYTFYFGYPTDLIVNNGFLTTSSSSKLSCYICEDGTKESIFLAGVENFKIDEMDVYRVIRKSI